MIVVVCVSLERLTTHKYKLTENVNASRGKGQLKISLTHNFSFLKVYSDRIIFRLQTLIDNYISTVISLYHVYTQQYTKNYKPT